MNIKRTFHPIGQGAFYTERHVYNGTKFNIVYDCGSSTLSVKQLDRKIKSTFLEGEQIDILFISHFHADHTNGIRTLSEHCKIKRVVIPYIENDSKIILKVANLLERNFSDTSLIDSPEDFFGENVPIIRIRQSELNLNSDGINVNDTIIITDIVGSSINDSGTIFIPFKAVEWYFIPFNYLQESRKIQFENALNSVGLDFTEIDTINKINKNKKEIKEAYELVEGKLNINSMILYSGTSKEDSIYCYQCQGYHNYRHRFSFEINSGCLYMGDLDLNQPKIVDDIIAKFKNFYPFIGILQIPHHGSILNFNSSVLEKNISCAVISFGTKNNYGHPSDKVIEEVVSNHIYPYLVTEDQNSIVIQFN